jgi:hypothetical protein
VRSYINTAVEVDPDKPVLVDKYLDRAVELDVDALCDEQGNIVICGIMEHIEQVTLTLLKPCDAYQFESTSSAASWSTSSRCVCGLLLLTWNQLK